jgi:hypothetical protein
MTAPNFPPTILVVSATAAVTVATDPTTQLPLVPLPAIAAAPVAPQAGVGDVVVVFSSLRAQCLVEDLSRAIGAVIAVVPVGDAWAFVASSNHVWQRVSTLVIPTADLPLAVPT